jgi:hypothetical protein
MDIKELITSGLEHSRWSLDRALYGLSAEEINWHPKPDANSISNLVFHLARLEDSIISKLSGKPSLWEAEKWYVKLQKDKNDGGAHYTAEQVAKFAIPDIKELLAYYDAARARTLDYIKKLSPDRLDEKVDMPAPPPPPKDAAGRPAPPRRPEPTIGRMLAMVFTECVNHSGEACYIRGLLRGLDK